MNKLIQILLLFLFFSMNLVSGEWVEIDEVREYRSGSDSTVPLGMRYFAIDCFDEDHCIAVGNIGLTWPLDRHTTDGGAT
jgi:hypothetical protein